MCEETKIEREKKEKKESVVQTNTNIKKITNRI